MEGITRLPGASAAEFAVTHPEVSICQVEGVWHGTVHLDCGLGEMHAEDEAGLLAKLTAALGG
jgi:hypothetical protein